MTVAEISAKADELQALVQSAQHYVDAEQMAKDLLASVPSELDHTLRCRILLSLCQSLLQRGESLEALERTLEAVHLTETCDDENLHAKALMFAGNLYARLSEFVQSVNNYQRAMEVYTKLGNIYGQARCTANLGITYGILGDFSKAIELYQQSLELDASIDNRMGLAMTNGNIGVVYLALENYTEAQRFILAALDANQAFENHRAVADNLGNLGIIAGHQDDYELAIDYCHRASEEFEKLGDHNRSAGIVGNIGTVYFEVKDYPKALEHFKQSLHISEQLGDRNIAGQQLENLAKLYMTSEYEDADEVLAEQYLKQAIELHEQFGSKHTLISSHITLAMLYKDQLRWEEYSRHYEEGHRLELEVRNEELERQTQQLNFRRQLEDAERDRQIRLARFQAQEKILHNILPTLVAERMVAGETTIADDYDNVTVFFCDIVDFTPLSQSVSASELVSFLNSLFTQFDQRARMHGLEKIKTIGDSYMAVCGIPVGYDNHAERAALFSLDVLEIVRERSSLNGYPLRVRIGLHSGSVVAGVIGESKYAFDLWGDAVNLASRMESHGEADRIHCTEAVVQLLESSSEGFVFEDRGTRGVKGKGEMRTYFLGRS